MRCDCIGRRFLSNNPDWSLLQVLEDDKSFLMGHVLVGASESLAPQSHEDSLDAKARLDLAASIARSGASLDPASTWCRRSGWGTGWADVCMW